MSRILPAAVLAANLCAVVVAATAWIRNYLSYRGDSDLTIYYLAAQIGLTHGRPHIYNLELQAKGWQLLGDGFSQLPQPDRSFLSPSFVAWLAAPFTILPVPAAYLAWSIVVVGPLVLAGWLVAPGRPVWRWLEMGGNIGRFGRISWCWLEENFTRRKETVLHTCSPASGACSVAMRSRSGLAVVSSCLAGGCLEDGMASRLGKELVHGRVARNLKDRSTCHAIRHRAGRPDQRRSDYVVEDCCRICGPELDCSDGLTSAANPDFSFASGTQVAHPIDVTELGDQPAPTAVREHPDRHRVGTAGRAPTHCEQDHGGHRYADAQHANHEGIHEADQNRNALGHLDFKPPGAVCSTLII
jgi:hypothetical protein